IEKSIVNLANLLCHEYKVEIISTYRLADQPAFSLDSNVQVRYLIQKYKPNREEWKQSIRQFKVFTFLKESYKAVVVLLLRKRKTIKAIKGCDSDIIISTRSLFNHWLGEYAKKGIRKIGWEHNHHHQDEKYIRELTSSCQKLDQLVLVSDSLRSFYKKEFRKKGIKCRCVYIPNMIDSIPKEVSSLKEKKLISIGRFAREKGFVDLIEVFYRIHQSAPEWKLCLVGDGSEKNKIVDLIYQYQLNDFVDLHGYLKREKIDELLHESSLYLMTSYTESFGIVLIEAMSHGVPCVAFSSAEGANDLITNDVNGYLIENRDFDQMADQVLELIGDINKRKKLGKEARRLSTGYTQNQVKGDWIKLLKKRG
ncbi:MAG: glycosyltransferase family 4 protein, partial [Bacilli bacterium]|nr:glycosyltransferase family 4 protein [Bacilli bacterium]